MTQTRTEVISDAQDASTLLRLRLARGHRPVDALAIRLERADGHTWLSRVLDTGPLRDSQVSLCDMINGKVDLSALGAIKERCKRLMKATDTETRLTGVAGYLVCIALGLHYHDVLLTSSGGDEVSDHLLEFAAVAPEALSILLGKAAQHSLVLKQ